ncbi:MAG: hypothetical protein AAF589_00090 [Planctomycetota bacterium]
MAAGKQVLDFEVQRCTRRCTRQDRPLAPGEVYYSVLLRDGSGVRRVDYSAEAWSAEATGASGPAGSPRSGAPLAWWRSRMPADRGDGPKLAPNDVLLQLFDAWEHVDEKRDARYVLALLLVRRRVFRLGQAGPALGDGAEAASPRRGTRGDSRDAAAELLVVDCPRRREAYRVPVADPGADRAAAIQAELNDLLYSESE